MYSFLGYLLLLAAPIHSSRISSPSYVGAVVEYRPITEGQDGRKVAELNAENFRRIIKKASEYNADIIVFPEIGLTSLPENRSWTVERIRAHHYHAASYVPDPKDKVLLCDESRRYSKALQIVSCAARDSGMYVVVNHHEKLDCPRKSRGCAGDGYLIYNTNVAFDRRGRLVGRYRKYNLFSEPGVNVTAEPEISTFHTDFGSKFGQIICNDILYARPTLELVKAHNVTDLAFSAEWFSELPFLTSVQTHSAFAFANDVNLLSSGFNEPAFTNGGSGIYLGRNGIAEATRPNVDGNVLIVSEVPKIINGRRRDIGRLAKPIVYEFSQDEIPAKWHKTEKFMYKDDFSVYTTEIIKPERSTYRKKICNRGLCCDFEIATTFHGRLAENNGVEYYRYRIGVFNGVRLFAGLFTVGIEVCGLFFCRNETLASCGERYPPGVNVTMPTIFHSINIRRTNKPNSKKFYLPMTLTKSMLPVDASKILYETRDNENGLKVLNMTLKEQQNDLLAFAIYGRNLENDGLDLTKPSIHSIQDA